MTLKPLKTQGKRAVNVKIKRILKRHSPIDIAIPPVLTNQHTKNPTGAIYLNSVLFIIIIGKKAIKTKAWKSYRPRFICVFSVCSGKISNGNRLLGCITARYVHHSVHPVIQSGAGSGQALSAKPVAVAGAAGSDFKARCAHPDAGGGAGACAVLAALCGASGWLWCRQRKARRVRAG